MRMSNPQWILYLWLFLLIVPTVLFVISSRK
jgi:hypothetical protein